MKKRTEILKRNPLAKVTEVVKEIAQSWKILTKEDRQKYKEAAKKGKFIGNQSFQTRKDTRRNLSHSSPTPTCSRNPRSASRPI